MRKRVKRSWVFAVIAVVLVIWLGSCDTIMELWEGLESSLKVSNDSLKDVGGDADAIEDADAIGDTDAIEDADGDADATFVSVSDLSLNLSNTVIDQGESVTLNPMITPDNATNKKMSSWESSDTTVAAVDANGTVTGVAAGTAIITATTEDGAKTAEALVSITPVFIVTEKTGWIDTFTAISNAADGTADNPAVYTLKIQDSLNVEGTASGTTFEGIHKKVRLTGNGMVTLLSNGSLFRVGLNQTLTIDGPTLVGKSGNNKPIVYLDGGNAELKNGIICGNTVVDSGGGVSIFGGGTFTMSGGAISGNSVGFYGAECGGGVHVSGDKSTFIMSGGVISGNIAEEYGGGVLVLSKGKFEMRGGAISGNKGRCGGGVAVFSEGKFEMIDGVISGNTALISGAGGGVYANSVGLFTMSGGTIYGGSDPLKNIDSYNKGVAVYIRINSSAATIVENTIHKYPQ